MYNVQRRFTKLLPGLHDISYVDRLISYKIELLELRRIQTDLIMLYTILNGSICVNIDNCLTLSMSNTRDNVSKLDKHYSRLGIRKYFLLLKYFTFGTHLID